MSAAIDERATAQQPDEHHPHGEIKPRTAFATMGKQDVYRHMEPIRLMPPCLACHGKPKGEPDMLGFEQDGPETGDVIGLMSVTIAVSD